MKSPGQGDPRRHRLSPGKRGTQVTSVCFAAQLGYTQDSENGDLEDRGPDELQERALRTVTHIPG